ncbi:putative membrane protein [Bacteroides fragilis str. 2-F-2 |uniref:Putative membrane protein n=1 Tax=Bacteroides fragilis str. 2-F-2 \|nr:putative membrane protein [Bacteroides fragilis str. 34-F-2 \
MFFRIAPALAFIAFILAFIAFILAFIAFILAFIASYTYLSSYLYLL